MADFVVRPATRPGDLGWVVMAHGETYDEQFGWDSSFEALVSRVVADHANRQDPDREAAWVAEIDGRRGGCIMCSATDDPSTAQLRVLLVTQLARGRGVGSALVDECVGFAQRAGYRRIMLWTVDGLASARRIYQAAGFTLTEQQPTQRSFGHDLAGQYWTRDL